MADFGQTDFGQTDFGQPFWRPSLAKPTLARVSVLVGMADFGQNRLWPKPTLAKTDFGQNRLWPNRLWPKPTLAKPTLAKCDLLCGVLCFVFVVLCCVCVVCVAWVLVSRFQTGVSCMGVGFKVWFGQPFLGPSFPGPPFPWTTLHLDRPSPGPPKISRFFFPLPPQNSFFSSLSGVFSWNFGGVFEGRDIQMCTFWALWLSCETLARTPNAHI